MISKTFHLATLTKRLIKSGFQRFGFDVLRTNNNPALTLLGLKSMPIKTIIDVGANTGQFAKKISTFFPSARIYCFEPLPEPFNILSEWAKKQEGRVTAQNLCIGDYEGSIEMFLHEDHTPSSSLLIATDLNKSYYPFMKRQKTVRVDLKPLDDSLEEINAQLIPKILIKLDVQGYEKHVILKGKKTFAQASACIVEVNFDMLYEGQTEFRELLLMLENLGYEYSGNMNQTYAKDGHCIFCDAVFIKSNDKNSYK